jgi:hypothetical protein
VSKKTLMLKRAQQCQLDLALLPAIPSTSVFGTLDRNVEKSLKSTGILAETLDRVRGTVMLFYCVDGKAESWENEAYLRAGLSEFASIPDAHGRDLVAAGLNKQKYAVCKSKNPLLHLMYILRNVNIHAGRSRSVQKNTTVLYAEKEYTYPAVILSDLMVNQLVAKREVSRGYRRQDLEDVVSWFNHKQEIFGAYHLFVRGVEIYCSELVSYQLSN